MFVASVSKTFMVWAAPWIMAWSKECWLCLSIFSCSATNGYHGSVAKAQWALRSKTSDAFIGVRLEKTNVTWSRSTTKLRADLVTYFDEIWPEGLTWRPRAQARCLKSGPRDWSSRKSSSSQHRSVVVLITCTIILRVPGVWGRSPPSLNI